MCNRVLDPGVGAHRPIIVYATNAKVRHYIDYMNNECNHIYCNDSINFLTAGWRREHGYDFNAPFQLKKITPTLKY